MAFNFEEWKDAVLAMAQGMIRANDLLEASGLIHSDYLEEDIADLMREIEDDLDKVAHRPSKPEPDSPR